MLGQATARGHVFRQQNRWKRDFYSAFERFQKRAISPEPWFFGRVFSCLAGNFPPLKTAYAPVVPPRR